MMRPTGSRLWLAAICSFWLDLDWHEEITPAMERGARRHKLARRLGEEAPLGHLSEADRVWLESYEAACERWPRQPGQWEVAVEIQIEGKLAARVLKLDAPRAYPNRPGCLYLTLDCASIDDARSTELKTGQVAVPGPARNAQMRAEALAVWLLSGRTPVVGELLRVPERGAPYREVYDYGLVELLSIAAELKALWARLGEPSAPRLGEHCAWCPAQQACPAQQQLLDQAGAMLARLAPEKAGRDLVIPWEEPAELEQLYRLLRATDRLVGQLLSRLHAGTRARQGLRFTKTELREVVTTTRAVKPEARAVLERFCGVELVQAQLEPIIKVRDVQALAKAKAPAKGAASLERQIWAALRDEGLAEDRPRTQIKEVPYGNEA